MSVLLREREIELRKQLSCLVVCGGRSHHNDVHAPDLIDFVVVDLWEYDVLLEAEDPEAEEDGDEEEEEEAGENEGSKSGKVKANKDSLGGFLGCALVLVPKPHF